MDEDRETADADLESHRDDYAPARKEDDKKIIAPPSDALVTRVFLDDYRRTLFKIWKEYNQFEGNLSNFLVDCFDYFMMKRGVELEYVESRPRLLYKRDAVKTVNNDI